LTCWRPNLLQGIATTSEIVISGVETGSRLSKTG
jgi:hypothetical protein